MLLSEATVWIEQPQQHGEQQRCHHFCDGMAQNRNLGHQAIVIVYSGRRPIKPNQFWK
jgi:hypothetical protein